MAENLDLTGETIAATYTQLLHIGKTEGIEGAGTGHFITDANGTESVLSLDAGYVGIGTESPTALLTVGAITTLLTDGTTAVTPEGMNVHITEASKYAMGIKNADASGDGLIIQAGDASDDFALRVEDYDSANDLFVVQGGGNVGIGTAAPGYLLTINSANTVDCFMDFSENGGSKWFIGNDAVAATSSTVDAFVISNNNEADAELTILTNGNVGIGTAAPGSLFQVKGTQANWGADDASDAVFSLHTSAGTDGMWFGFDGNSRAYIQCARSSALGTETDLVLQYTGGDVGIGAAATAPTHLIELDSDTYGAVGGWTDSSDRERKENFTVLSSVSRKPVKMGTWTGNGSTIDALEYDTGTDISLSDDEILNRLKMLPIMQYNFLEESEGDHHEMDGETLIKYIGPTAQDFYKLFGLGSKDTRINSKNTSGISLLGVKLLIKAVQELSAKVTALESEDSSSDTKIAALEAKDTASEASIAALEAEDVANKAKVATLETEDVANKAKIIALEAKDVEYATTITALTARITALESA